MLKMIRSDSETKTYIIAVLIEGTTYIKTDDNILNVQEKDVIKTWTRVSNIPSSVASVKDWQDLYQSWGFGQYTYVEPRPSRRKLKQKRITKKDLIRARIREFKKSLVKRSPEQYKKDR